MENERLVFVIILNLFFGMVFILGGVINLRKLKNIRDKFKKTNATVLECESIFKTRKFYFNEHESYRYTVRYTDYKNNLVETAKIIENTTRKFSIGDEIQVYYNPNVTDEYVIYDYDKGKDKFYMFIVIGILIIFRLIYKYFEFQDY